MQAKYLLINFLFLYLTSSSFALFFFNEQKLKYGYDQVEIINDLPADKTITVYRCGPLVDLCRGPHIPNTSFVKAFACLKVIFIMCWITIRYI